MSQLTELQSILSEILSSTSQQSTAGTPSASAPQAMQVASDLIDKLKHNLLYIPTFFIVIFLFYNFYFWLVIFFCILQQLL